MIAVEIFFISFLLFCLQLLLGFLLIDRKKVEKLREEVEKIREQMIKIQKSGVERESEKIISKLMEINNKILKETIKGSIITIGLFLAIFPLLKLKFLDSSIPIPLAIPFIGKKISWIYWYVLCMFFVSVFLKKLFNIKFL